MQSVLITAEKDCYHCHGTGVALVSSGPTSPPSNGECFVCQGEGKLPFCQLDVEAIGDKLVDLQNRVDDLMDKVNDIFEILQGS